MKKICKKCGKKRLIKFFRECTKVRRSGTILIYRSSLCKDCKKKDERERWSRRVFTKKERAAAVERVRQYRINNPNAREKEYIKKFNARSEKDPEWARNYLFKKEHPEEYKSLLEKYKRGDRALLTKGHIRSQLRAKKIPKDRIEKLIVPARAILEAYRQIHFIKSQIKANAKGKSVKNGSKRSKN